jgi:hypothetical protein
MCLQRVMAAGVGEGEGDERVCVCGGVGVGGLVCRVDGVCSVSLQVVRRQGAG